MRHLIQLILVIRLQLSHSTTRSENLFKNWRGANNVLLLQIAWITELWIAFCVVLYDDIEWANKKPRRVQLKDARSIPKVNMCRRLRYL